MLLEEFNNCYYILYTILAFVSILIAIEIDFKRNKCIKISHIFAVIFILLFCALFGTRDVSIGTDTEMYQWQFEHIENIPLELDFVYYFLAKNLATINRDSSVFIFLMAFIYLLTLFYAIIRYSKIVKANPLLVLFSFVSLFFFQSLGINIIRQGIGLSFLLLGISYFFKNNKVNKYVIISFLMGVGFHFTTIIPVSLFLIIAYLKNIKLKFYYILYFLCLGLSALNVSILNFKVYLSFLMVDERRNSYLSGKTDELFKIGFKPQFVVFNTFFLLFFIFLLKKYKMNATYELLLKYYILMSAIFFMMFQIPYSDRWGVMSWVLIPFLFAPAFRINNSFKIAVGTCFILIAIFIFFNNQ